MKKNLLLRLCLILLVALAVYSCRTDQFPEQETHNNSSKFQLKSNRISLNKSKHKEKLITEIEKAKVGIKAFAKKNLQGKGVYYGNDFSIDTDDLIYIENGPNYHTYTFKITRDNAPENAPVENLLLTPLPDGSYKEFLIIYNLTEAEKIKIQNDEYVNTKGKTEVIELYKENYSNILSKSQSCSYETVTINISCASGEHMPGETGCTLKGDKRAKSFEVTALVCTGNQDGGSGGGGSTSGPGSGSGGGEPCTDCPTNGYTPSPCTTPQIPQEPVDPSLNIDPEGCGAGVPTQPNLPIRNNPCEKTKKMLESLEVEEKNNELKDKSKIGGEKGFNIKADGTTSTMIDGGEHEVDMGSEVGWQGGYHNHTPTGVKIFSPPDILKLLNYAISQPNGTYSNAFFGVLGSESCTTCTGGYEYHNYIIQFNGTGQDLDKYLYQTTWDKTALVRTYRKTAFELFKNPDNVKSEDKLNSNGLEKLFFETLKNMGMEGKVSLQRIDNGTIQNITQDASGNPTATPCP